MDGGETLPVTGGLLQHLESRLLLLVLLTSCLFSSVLLDLDIGCSSQKQAPQTLGLVQGREMQLTVVMSGSLLQVFTLLWIADWMVHRFWRKGKDPDSFSIPYLTALGDLLGTALLALSFHFLWLIGDRDGDVGD